jgi:hypothetical protein
VVRPGRRAGALVAGGDAGDVGPVRLGRVERLRAVLVARIPGEGARDDHLRGRQLRVAPGEACRVREAVGREEGARRVDPGINDRDLHALALVTSRSFEVSRVDDRRAAVHRRVVAEARIELRHAANAQQRRKSLCGELDREAVEQDRVSLLDLRLRDRGADGRDGRVLRAAQLPEICDG